MQETDRKYSCFKTKFCSNLSECCLDRLLLNKLLNFLPLTVEFFVFRGTDSQTGVDDYQDAFANSFTKDLCITVWEAVVAVLPT